MSEPRDLRLVPPSPSPSSSDDDLAEQKVRHAPLYAAADRFALDWMAPTRQQALTIGDHALALASMTGVLAGRVYDSRLVSTDRPVRKARDELHRVVGLCAVLDDLLAGLEDEHDPSA